MGTRGGEVATASLIELDGVNKYFGSAHVLRDVNLTIGRGEVVALVGPSGAGKSTLCRVINRIERIDSGAIIFDGELLPEEGRALTRLRADVGMVFQSFNLFAHLTVRQNVTLGPVKVRRVPRAQARSGTTNCSRSAAWPCWCSTTRSRSTPSSGSSTSPSTTGSPGSPST